MSRGPEGSEGVSSIGLLQGLMSLGDLTFTTSPWTLLKCSMRSPVSGLLGQYGQDTGEQDPMPLVELGEAASAGDMAEG